MATETFSDACIISCTVETNGPHGGDAGHGSRTVISLKDEGGTGWDARLVGHDGRAQTIEGPKEVRLEVAGDAEGRVLIDALEWAANELRRQWREAQAAR